MDSATIELQQIHAELAALRRAVKFQAAQIRQLQKARQYDDRKLVALLTAVNAEIGDELWSVGLLFDISLDEAVGARDLLHAIVAIVGNGGSGSQHRRLGMFLQQNLGVTGG